MGLRYSYSGKRVSNEFLQNLRNQVEETLKRPVELLAV
jgi:hypothetical protein